MLRELGCTGVLALCSLWTVACSEDEPPPPREEAPAASTVAPQESPASKPIEAREPPASPADSGAAAPPPPRVARTPRAQRQLGGPAKRSNATGTGAWEDEVAPPGSEVGRKPAMPAEDPWDP
jgi:hypothetical protein